MRKNCILFLLTILYFNLLEGDISDHFKKIDNKSDVYLNQMKNVDFIYVINLDQRPEKFTHCLEELSPYGITPYRFSAVNGWELSLSVLNTLGIKYRPGMPKDLWGTSYLLNGDFQPHHEIMHVAGRNYFCHCMPRGTVGIVLSHLSILQDAYDSGYETIWVMEDDIEVIQDPHILSERISQLDALVGKNSWDILFTDQDTKGQDGKYVSCFSYARRPNFSPKYPERFAIRKDISSDFRKVGARYGAYSMIVRRSGIKKILKFLKKHKIFLPYDMEFYLPNNIAMYTVRDDVVSTQPKALSDNGSPNYQTK
jgi:GR25 family glycosyltransferase involved in LPS biosynthesis